MNFKPIKVPFLNRKGGTGKSSISREVAILLDVLNKNTILVDVDPNGVQSEVYSGNVISLGPEDRLPFDDSNTYIYDFPGEDDNRVSMVEKCDLVLIPYNPDFDSLNRTLATYSFVEKRNKQIILICNTYKNEKKDFEGSIEALEGALDNILVVKKLRDSRGMRTAANNGKSILELYLEGGINKLAYKPLLEELTSIVYAILESTDNCNEFASESDLFKFYINLKV